MKNIVFDRASARSRDENGFLRVTGCNITKETVNPYYGREIPGWRDLGLEAGKIYQGFRPGDELQKSVSTWRGLPLMFDHHPDSAENPQKDARVGAVGTDVAWNAPYLTASLTVWDADAQAEIESGAFKELSCAYIYDADFTPGEFEGQKYDFVMRNIKGNHVALVREGRAGPDVVVADSQIARPPAGFSFHEKEKQMGIMEILNALKALVASAEKDVEPTPGGGTGDADAAPAPTKEQDPAPAPVAAPAAAPGSKDDDLDKIGAELFALIDTIQDKELAAQIKAKINEIRGGDQVTGDGDQVTDEPTPPGDEPKPEPGIPAQAMDAALKKLVMDAAKVKESAKTEAQAHFRSLYEAARKVRPLVGEVDAMAFDSAGAIYRHALKQSGKDVKTTDVAALAEMVGVVLDAKRVAPVDYTKGTNQSTGTLASILGVETSL
jgi:hypothetical protein